MSSPLLVLERAVLLHRSLAAVAIPHALGGALALAYHVQDPRGTNDIDLNVTLDAEDPQPLFDVLPDGLSWTAADVAEVRQSGQVRLYWPHPDGPPTAPIPVDLFLPQHAFHGVVAGRTELVPMLDTTVPIISATDLTIFKALFSRAKDWADIEELLRFGRVDVSDVRRWLTELVGPDDARLARLGELLRLVAEADGNVPVAAEIFGRGKRLGD